MIVKPPKAIKNKQKVKIVDSKVFGFTDTREQKLTRKTKAREHSKTSLVIAKEPLQPISKHKELREIEDKKRVNNLYGGVDIKDYLQIKGVIRGEYIQALDLYAKAIEYFQYCDSVIVLELKDKMGETIRTVSKPYTQSGLLNHLGVSLDRFKLLSQNTEFQDVINKIMLIVMEQQEERALLGLSNPSFSVLTFKNIYGWKETIENTQEITFREDDSLPDDKDIIEILNKK